ncbi:oxidoreductase-like protein [Thozetella sp. PMI_491]|nr:oxidoreductase-like protein [Thozetella sp. PMI_491]
METLRRTRPDGTEEIRTGLGWRAVALQDKDSLLEIPIVDLADMYHEDINKRKVVAKAMCDACINFGFFYAKNHGLPDDEVARVFADAKRFFYDLPLEEKLELDTAKHEHYWGYYPTRVDTEHPAGNNLNEGMNFGYEPSIDPEAREGAQGFNYWPRESRLPGFQASTKEYMTRVLTLSRTMIRMFALGLDLDEHYFDHMVTEPYSILKMCFYPASVGEAASPSSLRPHTDPELLTILLQDDIPSLEVLSSSGNWISAKSIPGTFVVNVGDSMSILTNGAFVSTMHRVRNSSGRDRYSVPFFLGANREAELNALPRFVSSETPARFRPISSEDYIRRALQLYYSKSGVEMDLETIETKA